MEIDMADGVLTLKLNTDEFDKAWDKRKKELEEDSKILMPASRLASDAQTRTFSREIERAGRTVGATLDRLNSKIKTSFESVAKRWEKVRAPLATAAAVGFGAGAGAVGLGASASPLAANTLSGSIQRTTAIIGQDFIPMIMKVSKAIQDVGDGWRAMDKTTRENVVHTTEMAAVAGAAGLAVMGVTKALSLLATNPIVAALGLGIGGAGAVIYNARNMLQGHQSLGREARDWRSTSEQTQASIERRRREREQGPSGIVLGAFQQAAGISAKQMDLAQANEDVKRARTEGMDAEIKYQKYLKQNPLSVAIDSARRALGSTDTISDRLANKVAGARLEMNDAMARRAALGGKEMPALEGKQDRTKLGALGPSTFSQAGDAVRNIQLAAGGGSELDADIGRLLAEGNRIAATTADGIQGLLRKQGLVGP